MSISSWEQGPGFSHQHQPHEGAGGVCFFMGAGARFLISASATCRSRGCQFLHGSRGPGFSYLHQPHVGAGGVCFFMGAGARFLTSISHM